MGTIERKKPPQKIRVTSLQEAQLRDLVKIEERVAQQRFEAGIAPELISVRSDTEIAKLRHGRDVYGAETDHEPAGYMAWADQPPGVAVLEVLMVDPEMQRYGIATRLLRELGEKATSHGIPVVVWATWGRDKTELAFLAKRGFMPAEAGQLPERLVEWREAAGAEWIQDGQKLWWAKSDGLGLIPGLPRPEPE